MYQVCHDLLKTKSEKLLAELVNQDRIFRIGFHIPEQISQGHLHLHCMTGDVNPQKAITYMYDKPKYFASLAQMIYDLEHDVPDNISYKAFCPSTPYQTWLDGYISSNQNTIPEHANPGKVRAQVYDKKKELDSGYEARIAKALKARPTQIQDLV